LTRVFTAEYSLWFDLVLPGMQSMNGPIPLGGTSNHFRTKDIQKLRGWDAFNVTEDCDLGIRLAKMGYTTAIIESTTMEEATSHFWNWYGQRSRWIKGYIQSYLVHMRNPKDFTDKGKHYHLLAFQFIVGGKILSMFINPLMWCITIVYFALRPYAGDFIESFFPSTILYIGVFSFVFGNFLYLFYYMIACAKRGYFDLVKYVYVVPFYWLMMSFASWRAVYEMIVKPHYWAKTQHGAHLTHAKGAAQSRSIVGEHIIGGGMPAVQMRASNRVLERIQD
jgi:glycosyltransferase XagB